MTLEHTVEFIAADETATERLGEQLARALEPGLVVALVGNLGAGKTRLVRAIAVAAGVDTRAVVSPTFVLVQEYQGKWPIYHFDTYRLINVEDFADLGIDEAFHSNGICFVEWADRVADAIPKDHLRIEIDAMGENSRRFRFSATGSKSADVLMRLRLPYEMET